MNKITVDLIKKLRKLTDVSLMECKKVLIKCNGDIDSAINYMHKLGKANAFRKNSNFTANGVILSKISDNEDYGVVLEVNCESDFVSKEKNFLRFANDILNYVISKKIFDINMLNSIFEKERVLLINKIDENIIIRRVKILEGEKIGNYLHGMRIGVLVSVNKNINEKLLKHIAMHIAAIKPLYISPKDVPNDVILHEKEAQLHIALQYGKDDITTKKIVDGRINKFLNSISLTSQEFIIDSKETVGSVLKKDNANIFSFIRFELGEL